MSSILSGLGAIKKREAETPTRQESIGFAPTPESEITHTTADHNDPGQSRLRPFRPDGRVLKSELPGVSNEAWTDFVFVMRVSPLNGVSESNGVGMFDLRYKRLADLNLVKNVHYKRDPITNRSVQVADWVKCTEKEFLSSARTQYLVFVASVQEYVREIRDGKLVLPSGVTTSGALAILHRGGRAALAKWAQQQFESTRELFVRANGVF